MNEEAAAQEYLQDRLEQDATLAGLVNGIWLRSMPQTAQLPAVKIDRQSGSDVMVVGVARVWSDMTFLVRGVFHWKGGGQPDWTDVRAIGDRIDTLLHDHEGQDTVVALHSFREEPFTDETLEGGDLFLHVGGIYRVRARAV